MIVQEIRNDNVFGYVRYQGEPNRKDAVIEKLRKQGFRITKQRCILLDIILGGISDMRSRAHLVKKQEQRTEEPVMYPHSRH